MLGREVGGRDGARDDEHPLARRRCRARRRRSASRPRPCCTSSSAPPGSASSRRVAHTEPVTVPLSMASPARSRFPARAPSRAPAASAPRAGASTSRAPAAAASLTVRSVTAPRSMRSSLAARPWWRPGRAEREAQPAGRDRRAVARVLEAREEGADEAGEVRVGVERHLLDAARRGARRAARPRAPDHLRPGANAAAPTSRRRQAAASTEDRGDRRRGHRRRRRVGGAGARASCPLPFRRAPRAAARAAPRAPRRGGSSDRLQRRGRGLRRRADVRLVARQVHAAGRADHAVVDDLDLAPPSPPR